MSVGLFIVLVGLFIALVGLFIGLVGLFIVPARAELAAQRFAPALPHVCAQPSDPLLVPVCVCVHACVRVCLTCVPCVCVLRVCACVRTLYVCACALHVL